MFMDMLLEMHKKFGLAYRLDDLEWCEKFDDLLLELKEKVDCLVEEHGLNERVSL
jgi:hypothetical protein